MLEVTLEEDCFNIYCENTYYSSKDINEIIPQLKEWVAKCPENCLIESYPGLFLSSDWELIEDKLKDLGVNTYPKEGEWGYYISMDFTYLNPKEHCSVDKWGNYAYTYNVDLQDNIKLVINLKSDCFVLFLDNTRFKNEYNYPSEKELKELREKFAYKNCKYSNLFSHDFCVWLLKSNYANYFSMIDGEDAAFPPFCDIFTTTLKPDAEEWDAIVSEYQKLD